MWYDSVMCGTWLIYMWYDSFICDTWLIHMWDAYIYISPSVANAGTSCDSFTCDMTLLCVACDSFIRLMHIYIYTYIYPTNADARISHDSFTRDMTHSYVARDSFMHGMHIYIFISLWHVPTLEFLRTDIHVIWPIHKFHMTHLHIVRLIHMWHVTHSYVGCIYMYIYLRHVPTLLEFLRARLNVV